MKRTLTLAALLVSFGLNAQFTTPSAGTTYTTDNVGIGTSTPALPLHIKGLNGIRLEGTGTGTDIIDMLPGVAVGFSRLDYRAGNAGRGISFQLMPNGANTMSKLVLANQSDQSNFSSVFLLAESTGFSISPQHVGTAANPITSLSIGGGTSGQNWSKVIIPGTGNVGIGTTTPAVQLSLSKNAAYTNLIGAAGNPAVLIKNTSAANFNEKAELQFAIGNTDYASAAISTLYTKYFASNDVGADLVFSTKGVSGDATDLTEKMRIIANGNVGIGTTTPGQKLSVNGTVDATSVQSSYMTKTLADNFTYDGQSFGHYAIGWKTDSWDASGPTAWLSAYGGIKLLTRGVPRLVVTGDGNIGIGTTAPGTYKLAVAGTVAAQAVKVTQTGWADYVFDNDYKLPALSEVENYINQNKHLPGVPSAKEVTANGIDLGNNQAVLLKKIEELTLYSIEQDKKLKEQENKTTLLESQVKELMEIIRKQNAAK